MKTSCSTSSQDFRDGHRHNFEGNGFKTYLLLWLQQTALLISRWSVPSTTCRKTNLMVGINPRLMGRGMEWMWSQRVGRTCNRHPNGSDASYARVRIEPRIVRRGRRCLLIWTKWYIQIYDTITKGLLSNPQQ